jgi:hypothetical protein
VAVPAAGLARARKSSVRVAHQIAPDVGPVRLAPHPDDAPADPDAKTVSITIGEDGTTHVTIGALKPDDDNTPSKFTDNLAERLDQGTLDMLAMVLLDGIDADQQTRKEWEDTANVAAKYLGITLSEPTAASADGTISTQIATCLLEAVIKLWSAARGELLPVGGPVKVKRDDLPVPAGDETVEVPPPPMGNNGGPPMPGAPPAPPTPKQSASERDDLANALEQDLNWYLTVGDK